MPKKDIYMDKKVFDGIKVVDFGWVIAGPLTLKYLADYGATVICIESPERPDLLRVSTPYKDCKAGVNRAGYFAYFAGNKYSISLDLNKPKGLEIAKRLVLWADIVADSHRPGFLENWGLGYEELKKIKPDLIMMRSSNQGLTGPSSRHPGLGNHINGLAGFVNLVGWSEKELISLMVAYTDYLSPHFAAAALVGALDYRRRTGKGQLLDISQLEAGLQLIAPLLLNYLVNGKEEKARGNSCDYGAPHAAYRCKGEDRWCVISIFSDDEWKAFCRAIGEPQWTKDPSFSTIMGRKNNEEKLNRFVEEWTKEHDAYEVMRILQGAGVSAGVVQNGEDLYNDPQLRERCCFWVSEHPELGNFSHLGQPSILSETPAKLRSPSPCLGEHTEYVCRELLEISESEFDQYIIEGVFG